MRILNRITTYVDEDNTTFTLYAAERGNERGIFADGIAPDGFRIRKWLPFDRDTLLDLMRFELELELAHAETLD